MTTFNPLEMCSVLSDFINKAQASPVSHIISLEDIENIKSIIAKIDAEYKMLIDTGQIQYKYYPRKDPQFSSDWRKITGETAKFIKPKALIRYHNGYNWNEYTLEHNDIIRGYISPNRDFPSVDLFRPEQSDYNYILVSDRDIQKANQSIKE